MYWNTGASENVIGRTYIDYIGSTPIKRITQSAIGCMVLILDGTQLNIIVGGFETICRALVVNELCKPLFLGTQFLKEHTTIMTVAKIKYI